MCGFILVIEGGRPVDEQRLRQAASLMRHRGPDACGFEVFAPALPAAPGRASVSVGIAHHRLSIIDLDPRSHQPFRRGRRTLAYNGEIYNFRELRADLAERGVAFDTTGDTEVVFELLGRSGLEGLRHANGMWAFCHVDEAAGRLTASRDRYGKKPLYYHAGERTMCFASEIAPILAYLGQRPMLEPAALDTYLAHGWLFPGPKARTHLEGIRQVLPGGFVEIDLRTWTLRSGQLLSIADEAAREPPAEGPAALIRSAVLDRLVSDRKVGLLLSGGIDSSLILSCLAANGVQDAVCCFTGDAGKSDDADYARQCVNALGIEAKSIPLDYEMSGMDRFLRVCRHQEKPFPFIGNVLAMPQMYEAISAHDVRVVLDGTGGDEIFGGYWDRYHRFAVADALAVGDHDWLRRSGSHEDSGRMARAKLERSTREAFCSPEVAQAPSCDPLEPLASGFDDALLIDASAGRLQEWLWQNDRNAMLSSVENRSPLLDYRLARFLRTGYGAKFNGAWNKYELRCAFDRFQPLPTQWRSEKQGFRWVYGRFFRANRARILEFVAASRILPDRVAVPRLIDAARKSDEVLSGAMMQRSLCIAGLEEAMGMAGGSGAISAPTEESIITSR
jgi:asparagine synthase (glutamine-hydrolysing)